MKDYNDNKICLYEKPYLTINGEAQWIGTPSVFVRFQGCSVGCTWCDAMSTWPDPKSGKGLWMSNKQLTEYIDEQFPNCSRIWITGGEPTEHSEEVWSFVKYYRKWGAKKRIFHLITAGKQFDVKMLYTIDQITIDVKPPSAHIKDDQQDFIAFCMEDPQLRDKVEFKMVCANDAADITFCLGMIQLLGASYKRPITIQPLYWSEPEAKKEMKDAGEIFQNSSVYMKQFAQPKGWKSIAEFCEEFMILVKNPDVRILPQLHKMIWPGEIDGI